MLVNPRDETTGSLFAVLQIVVAKGSHEKFFFKTSSDVVGDEVRQELQQEPQLRDNQK